MRNSVRTACFFIAVTAPLVPATSGLSQDWPQWRGPNRDGVVHGVNVPVKWPKTLKEEWKLTVGEGVASPVVVSGKVYIFTRQRDDELVLCLDVATGKEVWRSEPCPAPYQWWPGEGTFSKGPRSTPTVAGGRIYTAGVSGVLSCLDSRTGKLLWRKQSKEAPPYGGPASPLVVDCRCIVHTGLNGKDDGLTAFDAATGEETWRVADGSRAGAGSPILVDLAGERHVVLLTSWNLRGVALATGKTLWAVKLEGSEENSTPLVYKDLIVYADYKDRPRAIRLVKGDKGITPQEVWKGNGPTPYMSTPVLEGDLLFGSSSRGRGSFFCLDARNGQTLWESAEENGSGYATILNAGKVMLFLTVNGRLVVVKATGKEYAPIADYKVAVTQTWAHPVFLGKRILIRDQTTLRSLAITDDPN